MTRGVVVTCTSGERRAHEAATHALIAMQIARLKAFDFAGEYDPSMRHPGAVYFVPSDTVVGQQAAAALGIRSEDDLYGAVVPHRFVSTKTITHPLVDAAARAPRGWCADFARAVEGVVLEGRAAFDRRDAERAGRALLARGPVRVKLASGIGGLGQFVVDSDTQLGEALDRIDARELTESGIVIEEDLSEVTTYSVGSANVAGIVASYWGTQRTTRDNRGSEVYGGSTLVVVRGGYDALLALDLSPDVRLAVSQARTYDAAAFTRFPGMFASRRNYDVARGRNAAGAIRSGVLEQSWRIGGASGAEIAALEAFAGDPRAQGVRTSCVEVYGECSPPPPDATVHFSGVDAAVGRLTKYARVEGHVDTR